MLSMCANDDGDKKKVEAFSLEVACELIGTTEQTRGVRVVNLHVPMEEEGEEEDEEEVE